MDLKIQNKHGNYNLDFDPDKYEPKRLLTYSEKILFDQLTLLFGNNYYIFPQVHLNKIITVHKSITEGTLYWHKYNNKINRKSLDFVVFKKRGLQPVLAIELDDWTHRLADRIRRDNFVDSCMRSIGLPILHIYNRDITDLNKLKMKILLNHNPTLA